MLSSGSYSKTGPSSVLVHSKGGFQRFGKDDTLLSANDQLIADQGAMYGVSAIAPQQRPGERDIALGQVHLRHDIDVREDERWAPV